MYKVNKTMAAKATTIPTGRIAAERNNMYLSDKLMCNSMQTLFHAFMCTVISLLKEGGERIFESFDENMPTSHAASVALVMYICSD